MVKIWFLFYNVFILPPLYISLLIGSLFNSKIRTGLRGRKRIFENLIIDAASLNKPKKLIWFHSSSLGEFEQAKPIIKELKEKFEKIKEGKVYKAKVLGVSEFGAFCEVEGVEGEDVGVEG